MLQWSFFQISKYNQKKVKIVQWNEIKLHNLWRFGRFLNLKFKLRNIDEEKTKIWQFFFKSRWRLRHSNEWIEHHLLRGDFLKTFSLSLSHTHTHTHTHTQTQFFTLLELTPAEIYSPCRNEKRENIFFSFAGMTCTTRCFQDFVFLKQNQNILSWSLS